MGRLAHVRSFRRYARPLVKNPAGFLWVSPGYPSGYLLQTRRNTGFPRSNHYLLRPCVKKPSGFRKLSQRLSRLRQRPIKRPPPCLFPLQIPHQKPSKNPAGLSWDSGRLNPGFCWNPRSNPRQSSQSHYQSQSHPLTGYASVNAASRRRRARDADGPPNPDQTPAQTARQSG